MKPLVALMKQARDMERQATTWTKGLENLIKKLEHKWSQEVKSGSKDARAPNLAQVVKAVNVPMWTYDMSLETSVRQLKIWQTSNTDVPENT